MRVRHLLGQAWLSLTARSSGEYWERRYRLGMNSGSGSMGALAQMKAGVLNEFVRQHEVRTVIEFGCGDGLQLALAQYPSYLGFDVSSAAIDLCRRRFAADRAKMFLWYDEARSHALADYLQADLTLSLDVIYHLLEDEVYDRYLRNLFGTSRRHVIVYSSNRTDDSRARHVRHRRFVDDVSQSFRDFRLTRHIENPLREQSFADFYFFSRLAG